MSYIVPNHYPTICGHCGSPLVKGEDGEMHCSLMCPHWQHSVELGFNDPASFAGWTLIGQPPDTPTYPLDIHDMEMRDDEPWRREQELGEKKLHLQYLQNRIPALQDEIKALSNYVTQLDRITEFHDETPLCRKVERAQTKESIRIIPRLISETNGSVFREANIHTLIANGQLVDEARYVILSSVTRECGKFWIPTVRIIIFGIPAPDAETVARNWVVHATVPETVEPTDAPDEFQWVMNDAATN